MLFSHNAAKNLSAEKLEIFNVLDDVVENGTYVENGKYVQKGGNRKETIRFDYFETSIKIDGNDYIVTFDTEVFPSTNNYRTHKVINEMDLVHADQTDTGTDQSPGRTGQSPFTTPNAAQAAPAVNTQDTQNAEITAPQQGGAAVCEADLGQKNTAPVVETDTVVDTKHTGHTQPEINVIEAYKNAVEPRILSFIAKTNQMPDGQKSKIELTLSTVSERLAGEVERLIGAGVSGGVSKVNGGGITHVEVRHGENGTQDSSMRNPEDIARMNYVIQNFDSADLLWCQKQKRRG